MSQLETLINSMELGRLTTHTLPLVCYFLNAVAEQRGGEARVQPPAVTQEDLHSPISLTN